MVFCGRTMKNPKGLINFCLFQLCLFNEATVPGYKTISSTLPQCVLLLAHVQSCRFDKADAIANVPSDTAVIDRHSHTTFSSSKHTGCGYPGMFDSEKSFGHVPPVGVECMNGEHPIHIISLNGYLVTTKLVGFQYMQFKGNNSQELEVWLLSHF